MTGEIHFRATFQSASLNSSHFLRKKTVKISRKDTMDTLKIKTFLTSTEGAAVGY